MLVKLKFKKKSITKVMKDMLSDSQAVTYAKALKAVKAVNPKSLFNERHFAWYKSAFKRGALKGVR